MVLRHDRGVLHIQVDNAEEKVVTKKLSEVSLVGSGKRHLKELKVSQPFLRRVLLCASIPVCSSLLKQDHTTPYHTTPHRTHFMSDPSCSPIYL